MTQWVFLHGGGQGSWVWQGVVAALKKQSQGALPEPILLDVPGCGVKRTRDTADLSLTDIAKELVADITRAGVDRVRLVGHSQGGQVMSLMASLAPNLFAELIYVTCSIPLPGQTVMDMLGTGLHGQEPEKVGWPADPKTASLEERYRLMFCNDMSDTETQVFLAKLGKDQWPVQSYQYRDWDYHHHGQVPARFIVCEDDLSLPVDWQGTFAERFAASTTQTIKAGHQVMVTQPDALAQLLVAGAK